MFLTMFDVDEAPTLEEMESISEELGDCRIFQPYIGGLHHPGTAWTPAITVAARKAGWRSVPIYVGRQEEYGDFEGLNVEQAEAFGAQDGRDAIALLAQYEYFGGSTVEFDREGGNPLSLAEIAYLQAWAETLNDDDYRPVLYGGPVPVSRAATACPGFYGAVVAAWRGEGPTAQYVSTVNPNGAPIDGRYYVDRRAWQYAAEFTTRTGIAVDISAVDATLLNAALPADEHEAEAVKAAPESGPVAPTAVPAPAPAPLTPAELVESLWEHLEPKVSDAIEAKLGDALRTLFPTSDDATESDSSQSSVPSEASEPTSTDGGSETTVPTTEPGTGTAEPDPS
jgi:hypothetical protein